MRLILSIFLVLIACGMIVYVAATRPDVLREALTQVDVLGVTGSGAKEKERVRQIMNLPIPYEKKQALVSHTIFVGATEEMMLLSFGQPKEIAPSAAAPDTKIWKYHFPGDSRPTVFRMENGIMVSACKGSLTEDITPQPAPKPE